MKDFDRLAKALKGAWRVELDEVLYSVVFPQEGVIRLDAEGYFSVLIDSTRPLEVDFSQCQSIGIIRLREPESGKEAHLIPLFYLGHESF